MQDYHLYRLLISLEGDGPLVLTCYEELNNLVHSIQVAHYFPNLNRTAETLAQGQTSVKEQLIQYRSSCAQPVFSHFLTKFQVDLEPALWMLLKQLDSSGLKRSMI